MASWYIHGTTGNDANSGLSEALPRKTMPADGSVSAGDIINVAGAIRSSVTPTASATGGAAIHEYTKQLTIRQWAGQTQSEFRGDYQLVQTGWVADADSWKITVGAITPDAVCYDWDNNTVTFGGFAGIHAGHLVPDSLANVKAGSGTPTIGRYNITAGVLYVYVMGDNPNTSGKAVSVCVIGGTFDAGLQFTGVTWATITGVNFALYPSQSNTGWAINFTASTNCVATDCTARDCGGHGFVALGSGGNCNNCSFINCVNYGGNESAIGFVHYQDDATGPLTGGRCTNCVNYMHRFLGTDGAVRLAGSGTMAATTQGDFYAHGDTGTPIQDVLWEGCISYDLETVNVRTVCFSATQIPTPSSRTTWSAYPVRADGCRISNTTMIQWNTDVAFRRCYFTQTGLIPSGTAFGARGAFNIGFDVAAPGNSVLMESCSIICDLTDAAAGAEFTRMFIVSVSSGVPFFHLVNCSIHDKCAQAGHGHWWFDPNAVDAAYFRVYGCVLSSAVASSRGLFWFDSGLSAANHVFVDNAYYNWPVRSQAAALDSAAEWLASVDTAARTLTAAPFPNAPTDLSLTSASSIWTIRRTTSTVTPRYGINNKYVGQYGCYQYAGATGSAADSGGGGAGGGGFRRIRGRHR